MKYTDQEKRSLRAIWNDTQGRGMFRINTETKRPYSYGHWNPEEYDSETEPRWYKIPPLPERLFEKHLSENGVFAATPAFWDIAIVDVDHGCPDRTIEQIGTPPVHKCATKRGTHLFYAVPDAPSVKHWSARTGKVEDENGNLVFEGEIAAVRRYAKIHHPNDFWTAASLRRLQRHPLPRLPELLNTGYANAKKEKSALIGMSSESGEIERQVEEIATKLNLKKDGSRWIGGCPICGHGDSGTRFQIKAGYAKPLMICRSCSPEGFDNAKIAKLFENAGLEKPEADPPEKSKYQLLDPPFISTHGTGSPAKLLGEAFAALGIEFRTNTTRNIEEVKIADFTLDRNDNVIWMPYDEGIESAIPLLLEWNIRYVSKKDDIVPVNFASTNAKLKDYIRAELSLNQHHPFKEWLERLPPWDEIPRIETMLTDLGLELEIDPVLKSWAESYLVIEPIRLNLFPGSERKTHLVLSGGTNAGKSQLPKRLFPPHLATSDYQNESFAFTSDKTDQMYQVLGYIICEGSEFTGGDIASIRQAKGFLSQPGYGGGRVRYAKRQATGYRTDTIYFTSNDRSIIPPDDLAMDGRLIIAIVNGQCQHDGINAFPEMDDLVDPFDNPRHGTLREQLFAEAYRKVHDAIGLQSTVRNPYLPQADLAIIAGKWNSSVGAHYATEQTMRKELLTAAIESLHEPLYIEINDLYEAMYREETGKPVMDMMDKPDYDFSAFKRQHPKHKVINAMGTIGWTWRRRLVDDRRRKMAFCRQ